NLRRYQIERCRCLRVEREGPGASGQGKDKAAVGTQLRILIRPRAGEDYHASVVDRVVVSIDRSSGQVSRGARGDQVGMQRLSGAQGGLGLLDDVTGRQYRSLVHAEIPGRVRGRQEEIATRVRVNRALDGVEAVIAVKTHPAQSDILIRLQ